jgi:hypothetical protein
MNNSAFYIVSREFSRRINSLMRIDSLQGAVCLPEQNINECWAYCFSSSLANEVFALKFNYIKQVIRLYRVVMTT